MNNMGFLFSFSEAWLLAPSELCKLHRDRCLQKTWSEWGVKT